MAEAFPGLDLDRLSLGRFLIFLGEARRIRNRRILETALACRRGVHAEAKDWTAFVEDLTDE